MDLDAALDVVGNWRSSHGYALHVMAESLERRARRFNRDALVAQRLKRMPSIQAKLSRFSNMQLSKMQDLGGCRAILRSIRSVKRLYQYYEDNPYDVWELIKKYDYLEQPKLDGYRGIHLVYKYQGEHQDGAYKGLRIEIQLRTRKQHAWAAAVETIDSFTGQALKSNIGNDLWKRFFALMSSLLALLERQPLVPNTPGTYDELISEFREVCGRLNVPNVFHGLSSGLRLEERLKAPSTSIFVLTLDSKERVTRSKGFDLQKEAEEHYLTLEKENKDNPHIQSVMVSVASMRALRAAYPSYFVDTDEFVDIIEAFCNDDEDDAKSKATQ